MSQDDADLERLSAAAEAAVRTSIAIARESWPAIHVDAGAFLAFLARRLRGGDDALQELDRLRVPDLYVAFGCVVGDGAALSALDRMCAEEAAHARSRLGYLAESAEDVAQRVKERLLVAGENGPAKLSDYAGTGPLRAWLRVTITRTLLNVATRESREVPEDLPFFDALAEGSSQPEADLLRASCEAELRRSLETAARQLTDRERALLRFAFRDRKTVEQIGAIYGVHGATASRWINKARQTFVVAVREDLKQRLKISDTEAASVLQRALSQVEVSLHRLLRTDAG